MENIDDQFKNGSLFSEDLAPIPKSKRTWGMWDMAAIWVGMAVCIPTYLLASYMIKSGLSWVEALIIIAFGNVIITIPMVLNGHAGVKYGIPFPVIGRASFGTKGIHLAAIVRGVVACGWFGIQTWIGGLAFYEIWHALMGTEPSLGLNFGKFIGFGMFWLLNVFFIWKGTESIKWLEKFAAPILLAIGILLIIWAVRTTGGFGDVLRQSTQLGQPSATIEFSDSNAPILNLFPSMNTDRNVKADGFQIRSNVDSENIDLTWHSVREYGQQIDLATLEPSNSEILKKDNLANLQIRFRNQNSTNQSNTTSSWVNVIQNKPKVTFQERIWSYLLWLTAMVGFWATMAISISDITRYTPTQKNQIMGQFIGLPGTMALFSFVGIFVTCASLIIFQDILISEDAPWDPVSLLGRFDNPIVVIVAQIFMIIATLSTNIAANVIAPANAFSNVSPTNLSFRGGGIVTAIIGIIICPWWLLDEISNLLLFVSGFLGPVLGILMCDYFLIRGKILDINALFDKNGTYSYGGSGVNSSAMLALATGVLTALIGLFVPALSFLYTLSWFSGFAIAFFIYYILMKKVKN